MREFPRLLITPEMAAEILEKAKPNRKLSPGEVERWTSAMMRGQWKIGAPIMFNRREQLIDGQHRLRAVIKSGISIEFAVMYGVDDSMHVDIGRKRNPADMLAMAGFENASALAGASRILVSAETSTLSWPMGKNPSVTVDDIIDRAKSDSILIASVSRAVGEGRMISKLLSSVSLTAWFLYCVHRFVDDQELVDTFVATVCGKCPPMRENDPAFKVFSRLNTLSLGTRRMSVEEKTAIFVKAWNAYVENRSPGVLKYAKYVEVFPDVKLDRKYAGATGWSTRGKGTRDRRGT